MRLQRQQRWYCEQQQLRQQQWCPPVLYLFIFNLLIFKEYINELRIERSKTLLLNQDLTILEVGSVVGFSDQSYYCKMFKRATGVSPDVFRKRVRRINEEKEYGLK